MIDRTYPLRETAAAIAQFLDIRCSDMMRASGISESGKTPERVSAKVFFRAWDAAERIYGKTDMGYKVGSALALAPPSSIFYALISSPNYSVGMKRLGKFKTLFAPISSRIKETHERFTVEYYSQEPTLEIPVSLAIAHLVFSCTMLRNLTSTDSMPLGVSVGKGAIISDDLKSLFGNTVTLLNDGRCIVTHSKRDTLLPFLTSNAKLWQVLEEQLNEEFNSTEKENSYSIKVQHALLNNLPSRSFSLKQLHDEIGMSRSSLQRRLKEEGTTFKILLDNTRQFLATKYLKREEISLIEISYMLGYAEPNSFFRAFKRLTGMTPNKYREHLGQKTHTFSQNFGTLR